ncbi:hypothetical protein [Methylobacterium organophilum]|uniref:Uncharacterized protein n=1 Tax=Methylobacterium organophilum TaxID=410 RepID=A0ABQ4TF58_METOR|nr:hypothetical protein [Methylobacterium organophilum]GJE29555.1 hypothetical protein LKMONMHP_4437 [Methylobacterium organophilum]
MSAGLSSLSDDELRRLYRETAVQPPAPAPAAPTTSLRDISDDELLKRHRALLRVADTPATSFGDYVTATSGGIIEGVPIAGPYIRSGLDRAAAYGRSLRTGKSYADELSGIQAHNAQLKAEHPYIDTGSQIAGSVAGTLPLVIAAPAAFGAGAAALPARMGLSALSGGAIGGADAGVRSDWDLREIEKGTALGGAFGAGAPAVGALAGAGIRKAAEAVASRAAPAPAGIGRSALAKLAEDFRNAGGPEPVRARLAELGPGAMLLDASPAFEGRAQGLAVLHDTREAVTRPIVERARDANARLASDVNGNLGPSVEPAAFHDAIDRSYAQAVPPMYGEALRSTAPVDTSDVLAAIGRLGETEKGGASSALRRAWNLLHTEAEVPGVGRAQVPDRRPEALHNAKEALDAMIATVRAQQGSAARSELRALTAVRRGLNDALEAHVPGYREANRTAQGFFQQREAFDRGQTLLNSGRESVRPGLLAQETEAMAPAVADAQRQGLRAEVDRLVGTTANDRTALAKAVKGEGDWNRARLATVFGEDPAQALVGAVEREGAFDASHRRIVENSMTELRKRAADDVAVRSLNGQPADIVPGVAGAVGGPMAGATALLTKLGLGGAKLAANAAGREADLARNRQLARAITMGQGDTLEQLLAAITGRAASERIAGQLGHGASLGANASTRAQSERVRPQVRPFGFR